MPQINLLPEKEKEKITSKRSSVYLSSLIMPIIVFIMVVAVLLFILIQYLNLNSKQFDSQISETQIQKGKLIEIKKQVDEFNTILGLVKQLSQYKIDWTNILSNLASQTPQKMQITKFYVDPKSPNKIKISGFADSYREIMLFKEKLEASEQFKNPVLDSGLITPGGIIGFNLSVEFEKVKIPTPKTKETQKEE